MTTTVEMLLDATAVRWKAERMASKLAPLVERHNELADAANVLQDELRTLYQEVNALHDQVDEEADLMRAGAGLTTGLQESIMHSMREIVQMKPESLDLSTGKRWLLVGAMSMGARRAMRKAVGLMPKGELARPSMKQDLPFMSQNIGMAIAMAKGYGVNEAYSLWDANQLTSVDDALSLKPMGIPENIGWQDLGFANAETASQFAQVGGFAQNEEPAKGLR